MILNGRCLNNEIMLELGLKTLRWLMKIQTSDAGSFRPVGSNGFYPRGKERAISTSNPSKPRRQFPPASKRIRRRMTCSGSRKRGVHSNGFSVATNWALRFTIPPPAAAGTACTWIGSARTRAPNPRWLSCLPSRKCRRCRTPYQIQGARRQMTGASRNAPHNHDQPHSATRSRQTHRTHPGSQPVARAHAPVPSDDRRHCAANRRPGHGAFGWQVARLLGQVLGEFADRHEHVEKIFQTASSR